MSSSKTVRGVSKNGVMTSATFCSAAPSGKAAVATGLIHAAYAAWNDARTHSRGFSLWRFLGGERAAFGR